MYIEGTIYKIVYKYDTSIVYIGSTFKTLDYRWRKHLSQYKSFKKGIYKSNYAIYDYFDKYNQNDFMIFNLRTYKIHNVDKDTNREQLRAFEQLWINKERYNKTKCINKMSAYNPIRRQLGDRKVRCKICNIWVRYDSFKTHLKSFYCKKIYNETHNQEEEEANNS
jgi:hypothetical protein